MTRSYRLHEQTQPRWPWHLTSECECGARAVVTAEQQGITADERDVRFDCIAGHRYTRTVTKAAS